MRTNARLLLLSIAVTACHSRWFPLSSPPGYSVSHMSADGVFNKRLDAQVSDDDNHYMDSFRFDVPAVGSLVATAKPVNPQGQISVAIYAEGSGGEPIAKGEPGKKVEATELQPGTYYVAVMEPWKEAIKTKVELRVIYKPQDPDAEQKACKTTATARDLPAAEKGQQIEDSVDYSAQRRTCFWHIQLAATGELQIKFNNEGNNINAEFVPPQGAPEKIDPVAGLTKKELADGDYYVKVFANDAGDAGKYTLAANFKQGDTCKNEQHCSPETSEDLKVPNDSKTGEVDFSKSKQMHYYHLSLKEKGKLTISFKVLSPRGSKVQAWFVRTADPSDEGERILGTASTKDIEGGAPGDYFIKVLAPEQGDQGKYALSTIWAPANFIGGDILEIAHNPNCLLTVSVGTEQGVRQGVGCTIVSAAGAPLDGCIIEEVYPRLSKVKPLNPRCNVQQTSKVQIQAQ